jgi:general secretion pathway protein F
MPVYEYLGLDDRGRKTSGLVDADSPRGARQKLRKQGVFPTSVVEGKAGTAPASGAKPRTAKPGKAKPGKPSSVSRDIDFSQYIQRVSVQDVAIATRQLSSLLSAGIPLVESIGTLAEQVEKEKLKLVLREVREKINEGSSLADALEGYPSIFSVLFVNMVRAGEQAGALDQVLERLADHTEAMVDLRGKVSAALTYPALMMVVALGVISFLMVFVIPKLTKLFRDRDMELPAITRVVMWVSESLQNYWWLFGILLVSGFFLFVRWHGTESGRRSTDALLLRIPVLGRMLRMVAISRFSSTLSTLMVSGVPVLSAMRIVRNIVGNVLLKEVIEEAEEAVREGEPMNHPLARSGHFPPMVVHMIAVGEKTGQLPKMLERVSITYEGQVKRQLQTLTSLLEPLMILVMGGIVFVIALAVLLPMMNINSMAGR